MSDGKLGRFVQRPFINRIAAVMPTKMGGCRFLPKTVVINLLSIYFLVFVDAIMTQHCL